MSPSLLTDNSHPFYEKKCKHFRFIAFWSEKVTRFVDEIKNTPSNAPATHHDLLVSFINTENLSRSGELNHKKREKGSKHDDLTLPSEVIEFKFRSDALRSLAGVLRIRKDIFTRNTYLYFSYFRKWGKKSKTKVIKSRNCIYYLSTIIFKREIIDLDSKTLLKEVIKEEREFTKEIAKKSDVNLDDEELYAVGNMIKEIKLEEELAEKDKALEEKDKVIQGKDKALEEKDKVIQGKDKALEEKDKSLQGKDKVIQDKDKALKERDKIIKRLREQLTGK
jgi:hypothetical protein